METLHVKITGSEHLIATMQSNLYGILNQQEEQPKELDVRRENEIDKIEANLRVIQELDDCY